MSLNIVSTLPVKAAPAATESSTAHAPLNEDTTAGSDFSNLLLSQLAPPPAQALPISSLEAQGLKESEGDGLTALMASLGIATTPGIVSMPEEAPGSIGEARAAPGLLAPLGKAPAGTTLATNMDLATESRIAPPTAGDNSPISAKAAIIAAGPADASTREGPLSGLPDAGNRTTLANTLAAAQSPQTQPSAVPVIAREATAVQTSLRDPSWSADFGQKVVWMATSDRQSAQLTLNPPQMGPIDIVLTIDKNHSASASFVSANADVREAIQTALPRLREMLAATGIELGQAHVGAESFRQQEGHGTGQGSLAPSGTDKAILVTGTSGSLPAGLFATRHGIGLVDTFA